ncbi:MAG: LysR family transcriptional regulator [Candidatus Puniceispirillales bacterium]
MKIELLQTFLSIIDTGSLSRAAAKLNLTQSTVTARLKSLEDNVGQRLINRQKSGVTLTAAGLRLQRYAEAMQDLWNQARHELSLPVSMGMSINLGVHPVLWDKRSLDMTVMLGQSYKNMPIMIRSGRSSELRQWMQTGVINAMIDILPDHGAEETMKPLSPERLVLVSTRPDCPVIHNPDYIFIEYSPEFSRQHATVFASADTARIGFDHPAHGLEFMQRQGGSAYMPYRLVSDLIRAGALFEVDDAPEFSLPGYLITDSSISSHMAPLVSED